MDTWAWMALAVSDEPGHAAVAAIVTLTERERTSLVTTNAVVYECLTLVRMRFHHRAAVELLDYLDRAGRDGGPLTVVRIDTRLETLATAIFRRYDDKDFSFVDCLSFAVMQQRGITTALTGDRHFAQMGFEMVPEIDA